MLLNTQEKQIINVGETWLPDIFKYPASLLDLFSANLSVIESIIIYNNNNVIIISVLNFLFINYCY